MTKCCTKCFIDKELSEFYKTKGGKFGVKSICKSCIEYKYVKKGRRCNPDFNMKEYQKEYQKKYREDNRDIIKEDRVKRYSENREHYSLHAKEYNKRRRDEDIMFRLKGNMRNLIKNSFLRKFTKKSKKTIDILGCDYEFFLSHLVNLFDEYMSIDNYGTYWEIDHIIPISLATDIDELIKLNHYSNLRPLKKE